MGQPRIRMRDSPLAELFRTTAADAAETRARIAPARSESERVGWRSQSVALAVLAMATLELGLFAALAVTVLTRPAERAAPASAPAPAVTRTVVIASPARSARRAARATAKRLLPRRETPVLVLNGNGIRGAAGRAAELVRAHGYPVTATADAPRADYAHSIVLYKRGLMGEARAIARELHVDVLQPLDALALPDGTRARLVLIVGRVSG